MRDLEATFHDWPVAALFGGEVVKVAVLAKPAKRAIVDASHDVGVRLLWRSRFVEAHAFAALFEDAVHGQRVKVNVQIEAPAEALRKRDGACLGAHDARKTLGRARDLFGEDAAHGGQDIGLRRRQAAKLEGETQDPVAHIRSPGGSQKVDSWTRRPARPFP